MPAETPRRLARQSPVVLTAAVLTALIVWFSYWARVVVIPLAMAIFLVHILSPVVRALRRLRFGHTTSVLLTVAAMTLLLTVIGGVLLWQIGSFVQELPDHREKIHHKLASVSTWLNAHSDGRWPALINEVETIVQPNDAAKPEPMPVVVASESPRWLTGAAVVVGPLADFLATTAITLVLSTFLLLSREDMRNRLLRLIGPRSLTTTTRAIEDATARISRYLRMQLLINTGYGVVLTIALLLLDVKFALLWGFFAMLMRYVPYVGTWIGLIPPALASFAMADSWMQPVLVIAIYTFLELFAANVLEPRLFGQSLGLSEVAQVIAAVFWTFLWGPIGLILSCPMTACLLVLGKHVPQLRCLEVLLGVEEPLKPDVSFFQRLTARDRDESWTIAEEYGRSHSVTELVDDLLIPALVRTQSAQDRGEISESDESWIVEMIREIADDLAPVTFEASTLDSPRLRMMAVPANGVGDALAAELLTTRLDPVRWEVSCLSTGNLASEVLSEMETRRPAAMVIVSLASAHDRPLRYLAKRVHAASPDMKLVAGLWSGNTPTEDLVSALKNVGVDDVTLSLSTTQTLLDSIRSQLEHLQDSDVTSKAQVSPRSAIGTRRAESTSVVSSPGE